MSHKKIKVSRAYRAFQVLNGLIMAAIVAVCLYPILYTLAVSLSSTSAVVYNKVTFYPVDFDISSYIRIFKHPSFMNGYKNTIIYTVFGTVISVFMTAICAYPLSKEKLFGKSVLMKFMVFTMFFGGGMIPNFLTIKSLGLIDSIWAIVLPGAVNTYYMIIMVTFFKGIPESLIEAGEIDGLNPIQALFYIILPLSKPVLATISLFYAVDLWNDWFKALMYLNDASKVPVMLVLRNIVMGAEIASQQNSFTGSSELMTTVSATLKSTAIIVSSLPILMVYPFAQKYFVKGVMIGAVKG